MPALADVKLSAPAGPGVRRREPDSALYGFPSMQVGLGNGTSVGKSIINDTAFCRSL